MLLPVVILSILVINSQAGLFSESCVGRCGDNLDQTKTCQCNEQCTRFGDCCLDYSSICADGTDNCVGRCGVNLDQTKTCQCNEQCTRYGDCCPDYSSTCSGTAPSTGPSTDEITDAELLELGDVLWAADNQRFLSSDLTLDISTSGRLFRWINEVKLSTSSYALFIALLDNYNPINGQQEPALTSEEESETQQFLDHVLASDVMKIVEEILVRAGKVPAGGMRDRLWDLWFSFYGRSSSMSFSDSSGFEHVFVGEKKGASKVNGFHSWVQMYELEKSGNLRYLSCNAQGQPDLMEIRLEWDGFLKERASMFVGTSPEFDMALYTLCMLAKPGQQCSTSIAGNTVRIQTYDVSHVTGLQVATAFPMV